MILEIKPKATHFLGGSLPLSHTSSPKFIKIFCGAVEMAQLLRILAALAEDPDSFPSTYMRWCSVTFNSSSRDSNGLFRPLWVPVHMCTYKLNIFEK